MSIIDCILSYLKPKKPNVTIELKDISTGPVKFVKNNDEFLTLFDDHYIYSDLEAIYWRLQSLFYTLTDTDHKRIKFIGAQHAGFEHNRSKFIMDFESNQGHVGIIIGCAMVEGKHYVYDMNYIGSNNQNMFHTVNGKIETENGFTLQECKLAVKEFLDYLNEIIPATKQGE
jgi:hypothetical protein